MSQVSARACVFGKRASDSLDGDLRAIVSGSSVTRLLDTLLSNRVLVEIDRLLPPISDFYSGAKRFTQPLDLGHAAALFIEKVLDSESEGALCQMDIATYYDTLPTINILTWLRQRGVDVDLLCAVARHQLLVSIVVCFGPCTAVVGRRGSGGLTGSRLAGLLSRIPVASSFMELSDSLRASAFHATNTVNRFDDICHRLAAASWVDNLYFFSSTVSGATMNAELMAAHLRDVWDLQIKPNSKEVLVATGGEVDTVVGQGWTLCTSMQVLGWPIQANGGYVEVWNLMLRKAWGAFWSNCRCRGWKKLGVKRQMALLARSVEPFIRWYLRIVPATSYKMKKLDALQRRMVSIILQVFRYPQETWKSFCSRRSWAATSFIKQHSQWWSHGWVVGNLKWLQHLERDFE